MTLQSTFPFGGNRNARPIDTAMSLSFALQSTFPFGGNRNSFGIRIFFRVSACKALSRSEGIETRIIRVSHDTSFRLAKHFPVRRESKRVYFPFSLLCVGIRHCLAKHFPVRRELKQLLRLS